MTNVQTYLHSGSLGDVIYSLSAVRALGGGRYLINPDGSWWRWLFSDPYKQLQRLLDRQPYIRSSGLWDKAEPVGCNLDFFRCLQVSGWRAATLTLLDMHLMYLGLPVSAGERPWLEVEPLRVASVVIQRSGRYRSPYFRWDKFLAKHGDRAVFIGVDEEYEEFTEEYGHVARHHTEDLYDVARAIAGSDLYAGNQSSPFAIAEGLKHPSILEVSPTIPNCVFLREGVRHFVVYDGE